MPATDDPYTTLPTYDDIVAAARTLDGVANKTPVETSRTLNEQLGVKVFCKAENKQRTGSFKFRGGYNSIANLTPEQKAKGVFSVSSGNHAQAVSLSSKLVGLQATIIMPKDAPKSKLEATKGYGGNIVLYDRYSEDRAAVGSAYQERTGATFIPPYDYKFVIAGQGTAGKELIEQVAEMGEGDLDYIFVCTGGGGLLSGISLAAAALSPGTKVIGVEPEAGNDAQMSLAQNKIVPIDTPKTIADGAQTTKIGNLTFAIMKEKVEKIITVSDDELVDVMRFFAERMKMVVEPTGCLALAGLKKLVASKEVPAGSKCGVIITGGNVDLDRFSRLLTGL